MNSTTDTKNKLVYKYYSPIHFHSRPSVLILMSPCIYLTECKETEVKALFSLLTVIQIIQLVVAGRWVGGERGWKGGGKGGVT